MDNSSPTLARQDLEDAWRVRAETARERYQTASKRYQELVDGKTDGVTSRPNDFLALARDAESALAEYRRVLRIFTELSVHHRLPQELLAAKSDGGRD